jgi:LuxR family maltose regulon positive regulatory protein
MSGIDEDRQWYRYHHLMSDLLQQRLQITFPDILPELHARACEWYEENRMGFPAIHHAIASGNMEQAATLVERYAENVLLRSELTTVIRWIASIPEDIMKNHPYLSLLQAVATLYSSGNIEFIEKRLLEVSINTNGKLLSGQIATVRALLTLLKGDSKSTDSFLQQAFETLPEDSVLFRMLATASVALKHVWRGEVVPASELFQQILQTGKQTGSLLMTVLASRRIANLLILQARLNEARKLNEEIIRTAIDKAGNPLPLSAYAYIGLGELNREWNNLEAAIHYTNKGITLITQAQEYAAIFGYLVLSQVYIARNEPDKAKEAMQTAVKLAKEFKASDIDDEIVAVYQARLNIKLHDFKHVYQWAQEWNIMEQVISNREPGGDIFYLRELELITLCRYHLSQGNNNDVLKIAEYLLPAIRKLEQTGLIIEVLLLKSLALFAEGRAEDALEAFDNTLKLAEPSGYIRLFLDEGEPALKLLHLAAARGASPGYISKLIRSFARADQEVSPKEKKPGEIVSTVQPLSERELEVIRLIAIGQSNQEIAETLFLSVGTVKKHVYNICGKLGTKNRTRAIIRAQELGLL